MEMILVIGIVACGWAFLCVLTGEHTRLRQEYDVKHPPAADEPTPVADAPSDRQGSGSKLSSKAGHAER